MMETIRCTDPRGRDIVLRDERWYGKILDDHPELTGAEAAIRATLEIPDLINADKQFDDVEVYYREVLLPAPHGRQLVKVVVRFRDDEGDVLSAYPVRNVHPLEVPLWP